MSLVVLALATSCASSGSSPDPGIAPAIDDPTTGRVGNTDFSKMRKLGTEPISRYLNCGDSIKGTTSDRVACGTTGRLEEHIRLRLIEKLNSSNG